MKKILVVSDNDVLLVGIERLLKNTADLPIHKTVSRDEKEIIRQIQETASETVIVDGSFVINGALQLSNLLKSAKGLRILIMGLDSNRIQIYDKREVSLDFSTDLTSYI